MITCLSPNGSTIFPGPTLPDRLAAATAEGVVIAERDGSAWAIVARSLSDRHIASLVYDEATDTLFACSYDGGVFMSADRGSSFEVRTNAPDGRRAFTVATSGVGGSRRLYLGTEPVGLFVSDDDGASWTELEAIAALRSQQWTFPAPPHEAHLKSITFDPWKPETLYASIEQGGLFRSDDGGKTFVELASVAMPDDASGKDIHRLVVNPLDPAVLYCTGGDGLVSSEDAGASWRRIHGRGYTVGYPDALIVDPRDPARLFVAGAEHGPGWWRQSHTANAHVATSRDRGVTWTLADEGLPKPLRANIEAMSFACSASASSLMLGTTDGEVYESTDDGAHWQLALTGLAPISKGGHFRVLEVA